MFTLILLQIRRPNHSKIYCGKHEEINIVSDTWMELTLLTRRRVSNKEDKNTKAGEFTATFTVSSPTSGTENI